MIDAMTHDAIAAVHLEVGEIKTEIMAWKKTTSREPPRKLSNISECINI